MAASRSVAITGASTGIGLACVQRFVKKGWRVFAGVRKSADAERLSADFGSAVTPLVMEVTDPALMAQAAEDAAAALAGARLTGLVANAGVAVPGPLLHLPPEELNRQLDINVTGGLYNPAGILSEWFHSIYNTPSILLNLPGMADDSFTSLRPISDLAGNAAVAANINRLLTHYLAKTDNEDGLFTTPKEVNLGHVYNASSGAGFVVGNLQATANGDRSVLRAYDAHNDNPTDIRATASQHFYTQSDHYIYASSLSMPTPMGTHFTVEGEITFGRPSMTAKIIGIGNSDDNALTPYADVALNQKLTAPSDGFVVAWVTGSNAENVASTIVGKQWISGQAVAVAGSSQHWWPAFDIHVPTNSFCMPVRKNTEYEVTLQTNGAPVAKAAFVGVSDDFELQTSSARKHNRVYTAQTDGFLTAFIQTNGNGDRAMVNVYANPNESLLAKHSPFAETSVHDYDGSHIAVPYNTVTVPIAKGSYYKAEFVPTWGSPSITLNWTPFVIKKT